MDNYKVFFIQAIKEKFPNKFDCIIENSDRHYQIISRDTAFAKTSKNPIDKRLDFCAYLLAFIKTLDEKNESFDSIRNISRQIAIEYIKPKNKLQEITKRLLPKMTKTWLGQIIINYFQRRADIYLNNDGFRAKIITDEQETFGLGFGIDIIECGICKLFKKHNYFNYASILCEIDEITSRHAGLKLIRQGTIANGAKICDFRFKIIEKSNSL